MNKQGAQPSLGHKAPQHPPFTGNNNNTGAGSMGKTMPDPRIMLISVFVTGMCVWQLPPFAVIALGLLIACAFFHWRSMLTLPPRTISRLAKFIGFWVLFKIIMQYAPLLWAQKNDWLATFKDADTTLFAHFAEFFGGGLGLRDLGGGLLQWIENHSAEFLQTGIFCVQLSSLVLLGLLLAGAYSAYSLACAFSWCLRPLSFLGNNHGWKLALALALLLNYIPRIFETLDSIRRATLLRHLPTQGLAYWRMALPRFLSILAEQTWSQAIAIASRKLDNPKPWETLSPIPRNQTLLCGTYTLALFTSLLWPFISAFTTP